MTSVDLLDDPRTFLLVAGDHLAAEPVVGTVLTTAAERAADEVATGRSQDPRDWYAVARDAGGRVCGAAMRTAPFDPRPLYVLPMPEAAARELARLLHARGEEVVAVNGALPAARVVAEETARLTGRRVDVALGTRLLELGTLVPPDRLPPGTLRPAREDEADLCLAWFDAFARDADEQAGRAPGSYFITGEDRETMLHRRIRPGRVLLWEDDGEVVHLTGFNAPAFGVARIGPVYTPPGHRGRGLAGAAVAAVSRRLLADGARPCLFTDRANPASNRVYERLGFRPLVDMANLVVAPRP